MVHDLEMKMAEFEAELKKLCAPVMLDDDKSVQMMSAAKECEDIGMAVYNMIAAFKKAKEDGLSAGDVPELAMAAVQEVYKAVIGIQKVPGEFKEDFGVAMMAILKPILDAIKLLMK